jgi:hypothetical protein
MNRRSFIADIAKVCLCALVTPRALAGREDLAGGCAWSHATGQSLSDTTSSSGNRELDRALIAEVRKVDQIFQINPGYRFLRDGSRPNAYATGETQVSGTWGTVVFGLTLVSQELRTEYGGAAIAGIAGHEGAHIFQYRNNYTARLHGSTARPRELHADYLAGYYFARTGRTEHSLVAFAKSLFGKGDYEFNHPDHHGTPDERVSAMRSGYAAGNNTDLIAVANQGVRYVTEH